MLSDSKEALANTSSLDDLHCSIPNVCYQTEHLYGFRTHPAAGFGVIAYFIPYIIPYCKLSATIEQKSSSAAPVRGAFCSWI